MCSGLGALAVTGRIIQGRLWSQKGAYGCVPARICVTLETGALGLVAPPLPSAGYCRMRRNYISGVVFAMCAATE